MSRYSHYRTRERCQSRYGSERYGIKQVPARSKIMGVCAGIAAQFGWDVTLVRVVAVLCLITFSVPTFFAYIIAGTLFY